MGIKNNFKDLKGQIIVKIEIDEDYTELIFTLSNGERYKMFHRQDCCESVYLEDVIGEWEDIIGMPILKAEENYNSDNYPDDVTKNDYIPESFTWTFYRLVTFKGSITLRWFGESNGYYSESVNWSYWNPETERWEW